MRKSWVAKSTIYNLIFLLTLVFLYFILLEIDKTDSKVMLIIQAEFFSTIITVFLIEIRATRKIFEEVSHVKIGIYAIPIVFSFFMTAITVVLPFLVFIFLGGITFITFSLPADPYLAIVTGLGVCVSIVFNLIAFTWAAERQLAPYDLGEFPVTLAGFHMTIVLVFITTISLMNIA